ncbi:MAG TPA: SMC family ATPase [Actinomycetota bacterium]|nr:SMC family ATPase [Actinomycetota bacterium]
MLPLELSLEGFKSYRELETFSFEGRMLFGIVGPTGSGKSTILEGLIFALYGKTPRQERDTKKLINSQSEFARVRLLFESEGQLWEVIRVIRRKGSSQTLLQRPGVAGAGVSGDRPTNDKVVEILGLDFQAFCASVSLPQGEFDRFLNAKPSDRSSTLKGIFRLDRVDLMREMAKSRRSTIDGQLLVLRSELEVLPEGLAALETLEETHAAASRSLEEIDAALPLASRAEQEIERSAERIAELEVRSNQVRSALARLPAEDLLRELTDQQEVAAEVHQTCEAALARATSALSAAEQELASVSRQTGGQEWFTAVEAAVAERKRLSLEDSRLQAELDRLRADASQARGAAETLRNELGLLERAADEARAALEQLHKTHSAHVLRLGLEPGDKCPVCEQPVVELPAADQIPALEAAQEQVALAEQELRAGRSRLEALEKDLALHEERLRMTTGRLEACGGELAEAAQRLAGLLGPAAEDPASEIQRRRWLMEEAEASVKEARDARTVADQQERASRRSLDEVIWKLHEHSNTLSNIAGVIGEMISLSEEGLWGASKRLAEAAYRMVGDLDEKLASVKEGAASARVAIRSFRERFGARSEEGIHDVAARLKADAAALEARIEEVRAALAKRAEIEAHVVNLQQQKALYDRMVYDFTDAKFTAYLLDEQRRLLSRIGSEKFRELTGHYTFDEEGNFDIIDQRTGLSRTPDTLSGGETFLASLSLALALAEAVAMEGGRLGCFFLDEGFGSLDAASLDLALEGIEALATPGRVIGLISHVAGMQARLDDLIVLERSADGTTEVVQHEGPIGYGAAII